MLFGLAILATALLLSMVAAYYSVAGLVAIFSAATIPVIIMGGSLELGKIVATVWLHNNWKRAGWAFKTYLIPAVAFLMILTSMGIFGYLSKAHSDQSLVSGDATAKIAIYDEKIKIAKENIDANRKALKQMDEAVDQVMGRSQDEKGADKAVALRRGQAKERSRLLSEITAEQKVITQLNEERAPLAAEFRKVEAEVGPIKYIAALVYGDNPDSSVLERAVRLVIIMIVLVFDPLALTLILAANKQFEWARQGTGGFIHDDPPKYEADDGPLTEDQLQQIRESVDPHPPGWMFEDDVKPDAWVADVGEKPTAQELEEDDPIPCYKCGTPLVEAPGIGLFCPNQNCDVIDNVLGEEPIEFVKPEPDLHVYDDERLVSNMDKQQLSEEKIVVTIPGSSEYIEVNGKRTHHKAFDPASTDASHALERHTESLQTPPTGDTGDDLQGTTFDSWPTSDAMNQFDLGLAADNRLKSAPGEMRGFGTSFPKNSNKGDMFLRVDQLPSALYKFNGVNWIEVDKKLSDQYLYDEAYIDHLIEKIGTGEYDPDLLSDAERESIEKRLEKKV